MPAQNPWPRRFGLAAVAAVACFAVTARGVDVVIFKDGFKLVGRKFKEQERVSDPISGVSVSMQAARGFDVMEDGPKWVIFSSNTKQLASEVKDVPVSAGREYRRDVYMKTRLPLPGYAEMKMGSFDNNWKRSIRANTGEGNFQVIEQQVASMTPSRTIIASPTHNWHVYYHTRELGAAFVRNLLAAHPELAEKDGKPDLGKRLDIATFLADAGLTDAAAVELDKLKDLIPAPWAKEPTERFDILRSVLKKSANSRLVDELEAALASGRYAAAREMTTKFELALADAGESRRFTEMKAQAEIVGPRWEKARRLLRAALDELGGTAAFAPHLAAAGGGFRPIFRAGEPLAEAGEQVYAELHPDTAGRVELFMNLASQVETQKANGKPASVTPDRLVALAVTGWLKGKNGADPDPAAAIRLWQARQMLLDYQTENNANARRLLLTKFKKESGKAVPVDELAQLISLLPPPAPENLASPAGKPIPRSDKVVPGLILKNTGTLPEEAAGVDYVLRLPPEYHHGRPYPVLLALTHPGLPAEQMVSLMAADADRHGYIIAAPVWPASTPKPYDYSGDQHFKATAVLRDLLRHFRVDNDRVYLWGFGDGANFAMDLGASRPDLFAGVVAMGATPKFYNMFMICWQNCQKLPVYIVTGSINGTSFENLRKLYEKWMPPGFPAILSVYRGRGLEWYGGEMAKIFEWLNPAPTQPKRRVTGIASLRLNQRIEPWQVFRQGENRFYWVGTDSVAEKNLLANVVNNKPLTPAEIYADIQTGNRVVLRTRGVKNVVIWLDRDMIDWSKPVSVLNNNTVPKGYKPRKVEPDVEVMMEELYKNGDRSMLFLNKIEVEAIP